MTLIIVTHDQKIGSRAQRQLIMEDGMLKSDSARPVAGAA
jgi:predicted ABC-type transport system involved in lysophospholipase L1 biosynthesis ATPase subunit